MFRGLFLLMDLLDFLVEKWKGLSDEEGGI
jgi:hypothetical protein